MPDTVGTAQPASPDGDVAFAEASITLWANTLTLLATHMRDTGTPQSDLLAMLKMLHDTNEATLPSPRARASAARHLMAVYTALETG